MTNDALEIFPLPPIRTFTAPAATIRRLMRAATGHGGRWRAVPHEWGFALPGSTFEALREREGLSFQPAPELDRSRTERPAEGWTIVLDAELASDTGSAENLRDAQLRLRCELFYPRRAFYAEVIENAREHLGQIGLAETDEIRAVLRTEHEFLPEIKGHDKSLTLWACFSGRFLALYLFDPDSLAVEFPAVARRAPEIIARIADDVARIADDLPDRPADGGGQRPRPTAAEWIADLDELGRRFRTLGDTPVAPGASEEPSGELGPSALAALEARAQRAESRGDLSLAGLLYRRHTSSPAAREGLERVVARFAEALDAAAADLGLDEGRQVAVTALKAAFEGAGDDLYSPTARSLRDLERAISERARSIYRVDLVEWALSLGRRPIRRELVHQPAARFCRSLRKAAERLELAAVENTRLSGLLQLTHELLAVAKQRLRAAIAPTLERAVAETNGESGDEAEIAREKSVSELADRIVDRGHLDFPLLRDAIARSRAKVCNLTGAKEWLVGDPLLRGDRLLAQPLEGLYRRGEIYRRWLQRLSSLLFATAPGRLASLWLLFPLVGAFLLLEALAHTIGLALEAGLGVHLRFTGAPTVGLTAFAICSTINSRALRNALAAAARMVGRGLHAAFITLPLRLMRSTPVRRALAFLLRWVVDPLVSIERQESIADRFRRIGRALTVELVPALIHWILDLFRGIVDRIERLLYSVDDTLRLREGEAKPKVVLKALLGLPWSLVSYVVRLYINVLLEPKYNPVKHFPVVTVGHKIILPISLILTRALAEPLAFLGPTAATIVAATTVFLSPGFFGFLAWELKENWRLYAQNRPAHEPPAIVGESGETMARLLVPGFHSGTLPKLFRAMRRVVRRYRGARREIELVRQRRKLALVERSIRRHTERELLSRLRRAGTPARLEALEITSSRCRIRIVAAEPAISASITFGAGASGLLSAFSADADREGSPQVEKIAQHFIHLTHPR
ncbi:MAG: hypothetical protein KC609_03380 [Myxococcales bacterium]|nr:hypothetical protein [Myxococcales bacterium]